jgi:hypothetical protein
LVVDQLIEGGEEGVALEVAKRECEYGGETRGTVTPPSADCESGVFGWEISRRLRGGDY